MADNAELKSVTESLYKQGRELAVKNKTLSLLEKLYNISLSTLTPVELAEKITKDIRAEFEFEMVAIFNYSHRRDRLFSLGLDESSRLQGVGDSPRFLNGALAIENVSKHSFFGKVVAARDMECTEDLKEIWKDNVSTDAIKKIEEQGHIRSSLAYPLVSEDKVIGILVIELNRSPDQLATYEKESLEAITDVVAIALEKAILYEKLEITNKELAEANDRQEGLIHFISHQIKGYLTKSEAAFAGLIEGDYGDISNPVNVLAKNGLADSREGVETVTSILKASNLKKGTTTFNKKPVDLKASLERAIASTRGAFEAKGLTLKTEIADGDFTTIGDGENLEKHVIGNLIDNAIKYTPSGGIEIILSKLGGKVLLKVKDTGVGITDEDKKRLFTEGGRGKESTKVNVNSTGYGLFIAKQIVEAHGGRIWAESSGSGKGSTFFLELPIV